LPRQWKTTIIVPYFKKGSRFDPKNYRPIALLSNIMKLYERVLDTRIRAVLEIPPEQCGFRPKFSTLHQILRLHIVMKHGALNREGPYIALIDLKEAFERAWRAGILYRLWQEGIRGKLWRTVRILLMNTRAFVRTNFGDSTHFDVKEGVLQGSVLAALLFIVLINPLVKALKPFCPTISGLLIAPLLFADDLLIMAISAHQRTVLVTKAILWLIRWKSVPNATKSLLVSPASDPTRPPFEVILGLRFLEALHCIYLGVGVHQSGSLTTASPLEGSSRWRKAYTGCPV
jgi:hypothetical protein